MLNRLSYKGVRRCCMRIVNSVLCGLFPVCVIFVFVPPTLLYWPQNSKEAFVLILNLWMSLNGELPWVVTEKILFVDCRSNLKSCYYIVISCYACFEYRLLRILREENSSANSELWAERDLRKTTVSQEIPLTPTIPSSSLEHSGWICLITASQGLLGCLQDSVSSSLSGLRWEIEMC